MCVEIVECEWWYSLWFCFLQFGMKLGSVSSGLAQAAIRQLSHMMLTASDIDCTKRVLIQACSIVRRLYCGNAEIHQVSWSSVGLERYWYWVIGYWVNSQILDSIVIGGYFLLFWQPIQYQSDSSQLVPLVTCTLTDAIICVDTMLICYCLLNTIIVIIIEFWDFLWSLLCYTPVVLILVLVLLEANIIGYWVPFLVSF